jgi:transposase
VKKKGAVIPREVKSRFNVPALMVWGAIGHNFRSPLMIIRRSVDENGKSIGMDAKKYVRLLSRSGVVKKLRTRVFMQDGARCHQARSTKDYLFRQGIQLLEPWPAHSPDINPIEQVWALLDRRISELGVANSIGELESLAKKAWNSIPQATLNAFAESFADKVRRCVANNGACV